MICRWRALLSPTWLGMVTGIYQECIGIEVDEVSS